MADKIIGYGKGEFPDAKTGKNVKWAKLYCTAPMDETHDKDKCFVGERAYSLSVDFDLADSIFSEVLLGELHECYFNQYRKVIRVNCGANPF